MYFYSAITIFVTHLPATELPKVFILSAFMLWLFGFIYSKIEHGSLTRHIIYFVLVFNGLCILLFRAFIHLENERWFLYLFLAGFNILYLLNNLEFWGLVSLLYDVRQSKRLFAIVSAWDGPARLVGVGIAFLFQHFIDTADFLWIAAGFMLLSILLFAPLARSEQMRDLAPKHHHHFATQNIQQIQAAIMGNRLIRNVALVSFLSFCFYLVTNFVLYGYIKHEIHNDKMLGYFFAIFLVITRGLTMILKLMFINRLIDELGLRRSLLIAPILLFILSVISFLVTRFEPVKPGFYLFVVMAILVDILRSSIQSPVLLATLQPLPTSQRLRGHTIIKGLMDPFAFLATGLVLLAITGQGHSINLQWLSGLLIVVAGTWIYFSLSVDSNYIRSLTAAIRKRMLNERDITISDTDSLNYLLNRIEKGSEEEVLSVLHLVSTQPVNREKFYIKALAHRSPKIRQVALRYIQSLHAPGSLPVLKNMLGEEKDLSVLPQLVRTLAALDQEEDLSAYFHHPNQEVANAAVMAWLSQDDEGRKKNASEYLSGLFASGQVNAAINALQIVGELSAGEFSGEVINLLNHEDPAVRMKAIQTAGRIANENLLNRLLEKFIQTDHDKEILDALRIAGEPSLRYIRPLLRGKQLGFVKRQRLYALIGRIGGESAVDLLLDCLPLYAGDQQAILAVLYQLHFRAGPNDTQFRNRLSDALQAAALVVFVLRYLDRSPRNRELLTRALELDVRALKTTCLWLFSFICDEEKIRRAKTGFDAGTRESVANAYELVQMTVPKEFAIPFITVFEHGDSEHAVVQLRRIFEEPVLTEEEMIRNILTDRQMIFSDWTRAVVLYLFRDKALQLGQAALPALKQSDNLILRETALAISDANPLH